MGHFGTYCLYFVAETTQNHESHEHAKIYSYTSNAYL